GILWTAPGLVASEDSLGRPINTSHHEDPIADRIPETIQMIPETTTVQDAYDAWHARHEVDAEANSPWHQMIKATLDPARDLTGRRVLEIGCGRGGFACWLARPPAGPTEVVAADFSPAAVAKAEQFAASQGVNRVLWTVADIQQLDQFGPE